MGILDYIESIIDAILDGIQSIVEALLNLPFIS